MPNSTHILRGSVLPRLHVSTRPEIDTQDLPTRPMPQTPNIHLDRAEESNDLVVRHLLGVHYLTLGKIEEEPCALACKKDSPHDHRSGSQQ
eukprot:3409318-Pyramimonas_sp.AAC.1